LSVLLFCVIYLTKTVLFRTNTAKFRLDTETDK
jgi:hypothetical protein